MAPSVLGLARVHEDSTAVPSQVVGRRAHARGGQWLGRIDALVYDPETRTSWLVLNRSRLGRRHVLVPAVGMTQLNRRDVGLLLALETVREAPLLLSADALASGSSLSPWYRHYRRHGLRLERSRGAGRPFVVETVPDFGLGSGSDPS
jgi:hypothetical protein